MSAEATSFPQLPTPLGTSDRDQISLLGQDVAGDLMGQAGFAELAFWLPPARGSCRSG